MVQSLIVLYRTLWKLIMFVFTNKFKKMKYLKILIIILFITNISCEYEKNNQINEGEISKRVDEILNMMTLDEKVGQMTQIDQRFLDTITDLSTYHIGSLLSGGGSHPEINEPQAWLDMYNKYQNEALKSRLQIPLIYGIDAVHGHNNVYGATIFPHNIGLGATNNPDIVFKVSEITSKEVAATGIDWTFSPCLSSPEDYRWGRTYEGFSSDPALVANLGSAAVSGYQSVENMNGKKVIACAKHFVGDGNTEFGTGMNGLVDRGNTILTIDELKENILQVEDSIQLMLLPKDKADANDVILEIRAGTGGDEAAIFAGDLYRMYQRYSDLNKWKTQIMALSDGDVGGYKEIILSISGENVFSKLKFESGVHRVQRVPATESSGRIHTSAATEAVLPEAQEVDDEINDIDLEENISNWIRTITKKSPNAIVSGLKSFQNIYVDKKIIGKLNDELHKLKKSDDFIEGIKSFREKRKPRWK